jgi:hypothetical protein
MKMKLRLSERPFVRSRGISRKSRAIARRPLAREEQQEILPRSPRLRANRPSLWSHIMQTSSAKLLAIAVLIELIFLVGAERFLIGAGRHPNPVTVSIEATELWYNPWPAPGDQTLVANGQCRIPSGACVPAGNSQTSGSNDVRAAF